MSLSLQEDGIAEAVDALEHDILNKQLTMNVEYKVGSTSYVTLMYADTKDDVAAGLIGDGLLLVEPRREKRLRKLVDSYNKAQDKAKANRVRV